MEHSQRVLTDLLAAHGDALATEPEEFAGRYRVLFPDETEALAPLFTLAEELQQLFAHPMVPRAAFRSELKRDLLAQARQQQQRRPYPWRWAAFGASVTVASVIAAAAWRNHHTRGAI